MKLLPWPTLLTLVPAVFGNGESRKPDDHLTVTTPTGSYVGFVDPKYPNTRQFRSVAFAEPPVTSRRWLPPKRLLPSRRRHYAYNFPPSCPQFVSSTPTLWNQELAKGNLIFNGDQNHTSGFVGEATSEDCLYLAIWSPATATPRSKLPVLFFMTGGGFQTGGVNIKWQLPTDWVERSQEHIVVTINYRVNIFGFPNARGLSDQNQNLGLLDQRMALEWIRDNIAGFGGDPRKITQWGQSAGSISADYHSYAYFDDPIARGYILQSGTAGTGNKLTLSSDSAQSNFSFVAEHFGCGFHDDEAELDCMRHVPFAMIENFVGQYQDRGTQPPISFSPVADETLVFSNYTARSAAGQVARAPVVISNCANEMSSLIAYPIHNLTAGPWEPGVLAADLASWVCPTAHATVLRNACDIPVYRYQHAGTFPNLNPFKWLGAYHAADLPMNFGTYGLLKHLGRTTKFEAEVSRSMQDHLLAFVKDPHRGPQQLGWEPLDAGAPHGGSLVRFGADGKVVQHVNGVEVDGPCKGIGSYDQFP